MKQACFQLPYHILTPGIDVLPEVDARLIEAAKAATQTSYAPYSNFCVGAAVLLENGETVCGSNQENERPFIMPMRSFPGCVPWPLLWPRAKRAKMDFSSSLSALVECADR